MLPLFVSFVYFLFIWRLENSWWTPSGKVKSYIPMYLLLIKMYEVKTDEESHIYLILMVGKSTSPLRTDLPIISLYDI